MDWFDCEVGAEKLTRLTPYLRHGARVTFYFDDRIQRGALTPRVVNEIRQIMRDNGGEAVVGVPTATPSIDATLLGGDLDAWLAERSAGETVYWGRYPAPDDDGVDAVTLVLPDADGIVRRHAY